MTANKIYVIEPKTSDARGQGWGSPAERDALGEAIGKLAKSANTPVFFHVNTLQMAGAPIILLECSGTFLESVRNLPEFGRASEKQAYFSTERSSDLWSRFTGEPATPARGADQPPPKKPVKRYRM